MKKNGAPLSSRKEYAETKRDALKKDELHLSYRSEMHFYNLIKQGNIKELEVMKPKLLVKGQGILSDDAFRNVKYHFVIATAMITRFCVDGGMPKENAYGLSDFFIRRMDGLWEQDDIEKLHHEMILTFARSMRNLKKTSGSSLYIRKAIDWIAGHFQQPIKISEIASYLGLSEKYLCSLFKKETGTTITAWIECVRIEEACSLLTYTDIPYAEIAESLSFSSHSYFSKVFKKNMLMTPMQWRMKNRSVAFSAENENPSTPPPTAVHDMIFFKGIFSLFFRQKIFFESDCNAASQCFSSFHIFLKSSGQNQLQISSGGILTFVIYQCKKCDKI